MRSSLVPVALILLLLGLVILLPKRQAGLAAGGQYVLPGATSAGPDVAAALLQLPPLELIEPPTWVQSRGDDRLLRHLDRLAWGGYGSLLASRDALVAEHLGGLDEEVLSRLAALGDTDTILVSKLVAMLPARGGGPEVLEELSRRALSESALVSKAALRVLARFEGPGALDSILDRRHDEDLQVRAVARAALAQRARNGDQEAVAYMVQEVASAPFMPDLAYLTVLGEIPPDASVVEVLRMVVDQAPYQERLAALSALLVHGDEEAMAQVEAILLQGDTAGKLNALHMMAMSGRVLARDHWEQIVSERMRPAVLFLMSIMRRAIEVGDEQAPLAMELLEGMAQDPSHPCQVEALDLLFEQGHPWAVERTRAEILDPGYGGAYLSQTIDRIERTGGTLASQFADLAFSRLSQGVSQDVDRLLLCRLLATTDPVRAADLLVRFAMEDDPAFVSNLLPYLPKLGAAGLERLADEVHTDRGAGLFIYMAAQTREGLALPYLEAIVLDEGKDAVLRQQALDCIVRLTDGPREDALRRLAIALDDPDVSARARLLFWNYL